MPEQSRTRNFLELPLAEFKRASKVFTPKRCKLGTVLLAFEGGFLSIESGNVTAVMRASGEWHGRATFSPEILRAIATVPPANDPLPISYADGHLLIGNLTIACQWHTVSQALIDDIENPSLMDLLALGRIIPRAEMKGSARGHQILNAVQQAEQRIHKVATQLADLEVTESDIRALVETKITSRLKPPNVPDFPDNSTRYSSVQLESLQLIAKAIAAAIDEVLDAYETTQMSDAKHFVSLALDTVQNDIIIPENIKAHIRPLLEAAWLDIIGARCESGSTYERAQTSYTHLTAVGKFLEEILNPTQKPATP